MPISEVESDVNGQKWSTVASRKKNHTTTHSLSKQTHLAIAGTSLTIVGKGTSDSIKGKARDNDTAERQKVNTESIYVGNLEETTGTLLHQHIQTAYKNAFREDVKIINVYPLVKRTSDSQEQNRSTLKATSFRVIFDRSCTENMLNALIWPTNVKIRKWTYNPKPSPSTSNGTPPTLMRKEQKWYNVLDEEHNELPERRQVSP
jgi:hypothetical protein